MTNASLATIRGLRPGKPGQVVRIEATNSQVNLAHQNAGSTAAYRLVNIVTSGVTPLAGGTGVAAYIYDNTASRWKLYSHLQGAAIAVPFNAGDFTASAGNWTVASGDVLAFAYTLVNTILTIAYSLQTTTVTATPLQLKILYPNSYTAGASAAAYTNTGGQYNDAGTWIWNGGIECNPTQLFLYHALAATNWATTVDLTYVKGLLPVEIA